MISREFEKNLKDLIGTCVRMLAQEGITPDALTPKDIFEIELQAPKDKSHGDIATNVALKLSKKVKKFPMEYASLLTDRINRAIPQCALKVELDRAEAKQPGFINFWLSKDRLFQTLVYISKKKAQYGRIDLGKKTKVNIEFVSANPTGPLTIAHGRQAAFGDTLANILEFADYRVTREYYLNDEGNQIDLLGKSIRARYLELFDIHGDFPEDGYKGAYINEIARDVKSRYGTRFVKRHPLKFFVDFGCRWIVDKIKEDLENFNVNFDIW